MPGTPEENTGIDILLVGIEVSVGISDTFFSEGINVSFAVHPVSILIHGADDVVALTVVEIGFASYLNGAVSVCRWIVVILISVGVFDAVLVEGVRDSVGILASFRPASGLHPRGFRCRHRNNGELRWKWSRHCWRSLRHWKNRCLWFRWSCCQCFLWKFQ